jgi:Tfp pilus assembly protein PilF
MLQYPIRARSPPAQSKVKKVASKLDPHCIDAIFHTCWSSPPGSQSHPMSEEEQRHQQSAKDIEVGYYYLNEKSYAGAESRLHEAVELNPGAAAAWIGLAQAQQKQGKLDAARQSYETYLKLKPEGPETEKVKKALASLQSAH